MMILSETPQFDFLYDFLSHEWSEFIWENYKVWNTTAEYLLVFASSSELIL